MSAGIAVTRIDDVVFGDVIIVERDGALLTAPVDRYSPSHRVVDGVRMDAPAELEAFHFSEIIPNAAGDEVDLSPVVVSDNRGVRLPGGERFVSAVRGTGVDSVQYL